MEDLHQHLMKPLPLLFTKRSLIELNAKTKYYKLTVFSSALVRHLSCNYTIIMILVFYLFIMFLNSLCI